MENSLEKANQQTKTQKEIFNANLVDHSEF
jgi:hypothetical protein